MKIRVEFHALDRNFTKFTFHNCHQINLLELYNVSIGIKAILLLQQKKTKTKCVEELKTNERKKDCVIGNKAKPCRQRVK